MSMNPEKPLFPQTITEAIKIAKQIGIAYVHAPQQEKVALQPVARRKLADALMAGQLLSNMAYNLQQRKSLDEAERACLKEGYTKWDEAKRALPKWMRASA